MRTSALTPHEQSQYDQFQRLSAAAILLGSEPAALARPEVQAALAAAENGDADAITFLQAGRRVDETRMPQPTNMSKPASSGGNQTSFGTTEERMHEELAAERRRLGLPARERPSGARGNVAIGRTSSELQS